MTIVVAASEEQWAGLTGSRTGVDWQRVNHAADFEQYKNADAFFSLTGSNDLAGFISLKRPVIINSVIETLTDLHAPENVLRINGWPGFLSRSAWEIAGQVNENIRSVFGSLDIKINVVKDEPGFVTARIIAMIMNEAYFALEDKVSSKAEIDTAMKLGTNYPHGPFEWAEMIGTENILALLQKLNATDSRYRPCELLVKEVNQKN
jgi:3-hydroxybutyryl-CoA dehydrogenase